MLTSRSQKRAIPKILNSSSTMRRSCRTGRTVELIFQLTPMPLGLALLTRLVLMLPLLLLLP